MHRFQSRHFIVRASQLAFLLIGLKCHTAIAQEESKGIIAPVHVNIPPGPNAASLGKFGDTPVSYYSGTPNISIPIYELKSSELSVPISLSYHASGVKVDEIASWVGLGWALQAGGTISRTVKGIDDFKTRGFQNHPVHMDEIAASQQLNGSVISGALDSQPDQFNFSFPGGSGKFFPTDTCTYLKGNCSYFSVPINGMRIEQINQSGSSQLWKITGQDGAQYFFGEIGKYGGIDGTHSSRDGLVEPGQTSAWHLAKMISPSLGDTILFEYELETLSYTQGVSESNYFYKKTNTFDVTGHVDEIEAACVNQRPPNTHTEMGMRVDQSRLSRITSKNVVIDFLESASKREDITSVGDRPAKVLQTIQITAGSNQKKFSLTYGYFTNLTSKRLRLESISEESMTGAKLPPYKFTYNESQTIPPVNSWQQDHWGYPNNNPASSMIPAHIFDSQGATFDYFEWGGSRDTDSLRTLAGVLTRITYPTGGYSDFTFEPHDYSKVGVEDAFAIQLDNRRVYYNSRADNSGTQTFTLTRKTTIRITAQVSCVRNTTPDPPSANVSIDGVYSLSLAVDGGKTRSNSETKYITLEPGTYTLNASADTYGPVNDPYMKVTAEMDIQLFLPVIATKNITGGARIKRIADVDGFGNVKVRKFEYKINNNGNAVSSGVLVSLPVYRDGFHTDVMYGQQETSSDFYVPVYCECEYDVFLSTSKAPLASTQGSHVGYRKVQVMYGENGEFGKSEFEYTAADSYPDFVQYFFPFVQKSNDAKRGLLIASRDFDSNKLKLKSTTLDYNIAGINNVKKFTRSLIVSVKLAGLTRETTLYNDFSTSDGSSWIDKTKVYDTIYSNGSYTATTKSFFYDNSLHNQSTRQKFVNSKNEELTTQIKFAQDKPANSDNHYDSLISKNMTAVPVEVLHWKRTSPTDSVLIGADLNEFNNLAYVNSQKTYNLPKPVSSTAFLADQSKYEEKIKVDQYDSRGNVIQTHDRSGKYEFYQWGYNQKLVIAKIDGPTNSIGYHTSFEDEDGTDGDARTGRKSRTTAFSKTITGLSAGTYILSYWQKSSGNWQLQVSEVAVTGISYAINLSGQIDELRFYPKGAIMTTYTYDPGVGVTSVTDPNHLSTFYEYDEFWRLNVIRDNNRKIIKTYEYNYKTPN